jgi:hypothetical protein
MLIEFVSMYLKTSERGASAPKLPIKTVLSNFMVSPYSTGDATAAAVFPPDIHPINEYFGLSEKII